MHLEELVEIKLRWADVIVLDLCLERLRQNAEGTLVITEYEETAVLNLEAALEAAVLPIMGEQYLERINDAARILEADTKRERRK